MTEMPVFSVAAEALEMKKVVICTVIDVKVGIKANEGS